MPYYKKKHILFIHIPKTGGTTIEEILKKGDIQTLYSNRRNKTIPNKYLGQISLQHQTFNNIIRFRNYLKVKLDNKLKIISVVRNPYTRLVSDLFFWKLINNNTPSNRVFNIIKNYVNSQGRKYDNHNIQQYKFITNGKGKLIRGLILMKQERLNQDMKNKLNIEITKNEQENTNKKKNYMSFLNDNSIRLINKFYKKDFKLFGYKMIQPKNKQIIKKQDSVNKIVRKKTPNIRKIIIRRRNKIIKILRNRILIRRKKNR